MEKIKVEVELKKIYKFDGKEYTPTGEFRAPKAEEMFLNSTYCATKNNGCFSQTYFILKEVEPVKEKLTFNQIVDMAKDGYGFVDPWGNLKYLPEITLSTEHEVYIGEHVATGFKYLKPYCLDIEEAVEFEVDLSTTYYPF